MRFHSTRRRRPSHPHRTQSLRRAGGLAPVCGLVLVLMVSGCNDEGNGPATDEPGVTENGEAAEGAAVYDQHCASCHGDDGRAEGRSGTDITDARSTPDVEAQVREGIGAMPAFQDVLSDEEIRAVAEYVTEELAGN